MKIIRKHLKLIVFITTCLFIYIIYNTSTTKDKINYIALGDGYAAGINSYEKKDYGYTTYLKDYLEKNNRLNYYFDGFSNKDNTINDVYKNILLNESNEKKEGIKQALRESNLLTLTVGFNDLLYQKSLVPKVKGERYSYIINETILNLDQLITEIKKYYKGEIYLVGYYNLFSKNTTENDLLDQLNKAYKKYALRNNIVYIEIDGNLSSYYENPNSYYPNVLGYKKIYEQILEEIKRK